MERNGFTVRPCAPQTAHEVITALLSSLEAPPVTPAEFAAWYAEFPDTGKRWEWIAEDATGRPVGYANTTQEDPEASPDEFEVFVLVDPAVQGQGLGTTLLHLAEETARAHGAAHITGNLNEANAAAHRFATRNGYVVERHTIDSRLDLGGWNDPGLVASVEATGVRLATLEADHGEALLEKLYTLYCRVAPTFPGRSADAPLTPYDQWRQSLVRTYGEQWDLVMIALAADRVVGMTRMIEEDAEATLYTPHTSIDPDYRGRNIGLALKLFAARVARERGARYLTTNNDADNHAILAINRRMGFRPTMSTLFMGKRLV